MDQNHNRLAARASTHHDMCLSYSSDGFTFIEPGRYEFQAVHRSPKGPVYSNVLTVWVRYPTPTDEDRVVPTFDDDVCAYFAGVGRPDLTRAVDILEKFSNRSEFRDDHGSLRTDAHPLAHHYYALKALTTVHGFRRLRATRRGLTVDWLERPKPDFGLFQQALGFDSEYRMGASASQGRTLFSNIVIGELSGVLARAMGADDDERRKLLKPQVMTQATKYLGQQKM